MTQNDAPASTTSTPPSRTTTATSTSPGARQWWAGSRGLVLALVILIVAGVAYAAVRSGEQHGRLDPRSTDGKGSRAVAALLAGRGVHTKIVSTTDEAVATVDQDSTLLVTDPDLLTHGQQESLREGTANSGARTVLVAPGDASLDRLAPGVQESSPDEVTTRPPACALPAARRAGPARLGGLRYTTSLPSVDACYPDDGSPTLLRLPEPGGADTVLLGAPDIFFNERLDEEGNASLALQLLGSRPHLVWYLPSLDSAAATDGGDRQILDLVPPGWHRALLQLALAALLAAIWRARRLGALVTERLPVSVRASETTEGRARLYRRIDARDRAAEALRTITRRRLATLVGVPATHADHPEALVPAVSAQLPGSAGEVDAILFGSTPDDDAALVRLAEDLDRLEHSVMSAASTAHPSDEREPAP